MKEFSSDELAELLTNKVKELKAEKAESEYLNERLQENLAQLEETTAKLEETQEALKHERDNLKKEVKNQTSKLVKMNKELNKTLNELKKAEIKKDEFLSMVSHELKTPLTPIIGWCEALKMPSIGGKLNKVQDEAINSIYEDSQKLYRLIGDVLDAQTLDLNKMNFTNLPINVGELLKKTTNNFKFTLKEKNIQLINMFKGKLIIVSDERRLSQVITNLINNAIDFVPSGSGKIKLDVRDDGDSVVFSVKDNGPGIDPKKQKNLFKKFFQADTSITRKHGGTGLGLAVCKGIINGLGGKIWVESQMGKGTTVYFNIPKTTEWEAIENTRN